MTESESALLDEIEREICGQGWDPEEAKRVRGLLDELAQLEVRNLQRLATKLRTAVRSGSAHEIRGVIGEAREAAGFARAGGAVEIEPLGKKGPDLLVSAQGLRVYTEVKRLELEEGPELADVDWFENEANPSPTPQGSQAPTLRLLSRLRAAEGQLVPGALNAVAIQDFSLDVTRSSFCDAVAAFEAELEMDLHRRLSAVLYHSFWEGSMLPARHLLWLNPSAPTHGLLERLFRSAFDLALVE